MRLRIYPYKQGSRSARYLARQLRGLAIKHRGSRYRRRANDVVINWGSSNPPFRVDYNQPVNVANAVNKVRALRIFQESAVNIPRFTDNPQEALTWGTPVVVRELVESSGSRGVRVLEAHEELPQAPLYTEYIPKTDEYRVHVFKGEVIFVQRKARSYSVSDEEVNWRIRSHANGFIFQHNDITPPELVLGQASKAVEALGLDFGAVDVVWNATRNQAYVLEVNTACGLEGETINKYAEAFNRDIRSTHA